MIKVAITRARHTNITNLSIRGAEKDTVSVVILPKMNNLLPIRRNQTEWKEMLQNNGPVYSKVSRLSLEKQGKTEGLLKVTGN